MEDLVIAAVTPTKGKLPEPEIDHSVTKDQNNSGRNCKVLHCYPSARKKY